jgi:hypothetical protein
MEKLSKETKTQIENKIEKLYQQLYRVQDTKFGTEEGRLQLNALNKKIGELEDKLK